jgi:tetratricopeptide (TPR) repeat protein
MQENYSEAIEEYEYALRLKPGCSDALAGITDCREALSKLARVERIKEHQVEDMQDLKTKMFAAWGQADYGAAKQYAKEGVALANTYRRDTLDAVKPHLGACWNILSCGCAS